MDNMIFYFFIFTIIIIIYHNYNNEKIYIKSNINNIDDKKILMINNTQSNSNLNLNSKVYIDYEIGGSKPFNNISMNDNNLTINQVNYNTNNDKYESYRKKPFIIKN